MNIFKRLKMGAIAGRRGLLGRSTVLCHTCLTTRFKENEDSEWGDPIRTVRDKIVTTVFVDFIVDQLIAEDSEFGDFKFHQCGLGTAEENIGDTTIQTDTGITAVVGSQEETDHDTYKSVAEMTMDNTEAITEHVLMSQTAGAGICMDRTKFDPINVVSGNKIEFTFEIDFTAGS